MIKYLIVFNMMIILAPNLFSQDINSLVKSGDHAFNQGNYYGAADFYEKALRIDNNLPQVHYKAAEAYRADNDYKAAIPHYKELVPNFTDKFPLVQFYLAKMQKARGQYLEAMYHFRNFNNSKDDDEVDKYFLTKSNKEVIACDLAQKMMFRPKNIEIKQKNENINTVYAELAADGFSDSLYFFTAVLPEDSLKTEFNANIYISKNNNEKSKMDTLINRQDYHAANPYFDEKLKRLYFTLSDDNTPPHIYFSENMNGNWSEPIKLSEKVNKKGYASTQPVVVHTDSISYIIYSSDKPSSVGGYDLYFNSFVNDTVFSRAFNIGRRKPDNSKFSFLVDTSSVFNTPGNEITPFYKKSDSTLYFSSDWYAGMGEFDIFSVKFDFLMPDTLTLENPGYPINTPQNDFYYRIDKSDSEAFFTSNRDEAMAYKHLSCCNDIFYYMLPKKEPEKTPEQIRQEQITGMTKMAEKLIPITLYFHNDRPDPRTRDTVTDITYKESLLKYLERRDEYVNAFTAGLEGEEAEIAEDTIENFFVNEVRSEYNRLNKFFMLMEELLNENQQIILTIKGYTSPLNTSEYNFNLAKRRISSFENYLESYKNGVFQKFIEDNLLTVKTVPFGETTVKKGVSDDPNDRRNSVYNPAAARERKIKIIALKVAE